MSIKTSFTDLASDIAAFVAKHRTVVIGAAVAASLVGGAAAYAWYAAEPGRHHDYWPSRRSSPSRSRCKRRGGLAPRSTATRQRGELRWTNSRSL